MPNMPHKNKHNTHKPKQKFVMVILAFCKKMAIKFVQRLQVAEVLPSPQLRRLGIIYSIYRFIIASFLMVSSYAGIKLSDGLLLPTLLEQTVLSFYLLFSVILLGLLYFVPKRPQRQLAFGLAIDVIILSLLLYSNGSTDLQLTMLYMVVVAASFMLLRATHAFIITMLAILFVIYQQFFYAIANSMNLNNLGEALLMSVSFLAVAFLSWSISQRLVQVEKMAAANAQEVSRLNAINHEVISKMVSGVLVIDNQQVVLANKAACDLLHLQANFDEQEYSEHTLTMIQHQLTTLHPDLCQWYLSQYQYSEHYSKHDLAQDFDQNLEQSLKGDDHDDDHDTHHKQQTADMGNDHNQTDTHQAQGYYQKVHNKNLHRYPWTLIYDLPPFASATMVDKLRVELTPLKNNSQLLIIEDLRREQASAQQLKLAALGQLTASIAHEIRNPLAAISQASELLIEDVVEHLPQSSMSSSTLTGAAPQQTDTAAPIDANHELYQMIFSQTKRVNRIIEDVLKLSRQEKPKFQLLDMSTWMPQFLNDHFQSHDIFLRTQSQSQLSIYFDPHHLEQILINLINNGLRYSSRAHPHTYVEVEVYCVANDVIIDILDDGAGVKAEDVARLFDPFFTTDAEGTGLGLYLSLAFSEANHARLMYVPEHEMTCFRLITPKGLCPSQAAAQ